MDRHPDISRTHFRIHWIGKTQLDLFALRDEENISRGDIEKKRGLLRCDASRVVSGSIAK